MNNDGVKQMEKEIDLALKDLAVRVDNSEKLNAILHEHLVRVCLPAAPGDSFATPPARFLSPLAAQIDGYTERLDRVLLSMEGLYRRLALDPKER
jgi:hypothetical protein